MKKSLVIVYSYHHNNTEKVADAMASAFGCEKAHPDEKQCEDISDYDIVGFGAGIDSGKHYAQMLEFAGKLPSVRNKKAFIFSTCGVYSEKKMIKDHKALKDILEGKGFVIAGNFSCPGYNTNSVLKFIGGMNKGRPAAEDLRKAADFALGLMKTI